jgi:hypothetical protein
VVEQVQEQGLDDVVAVVAERDLGEAFPLGVGVERAAAQPRAEPAHGLALGHHALDHAVGVLLEDLERHADLLQVPRQHVGVVAGLLLVEVHRHQFEAHRRLGPELQQDVEHPVGVLATGQADHHLVAVLDHVEVGDGLADLAPQALGQLVELVLRLARIGGGHDRHPAGPRIVPGLSTSGRADRRLGGALHSVGQSARIAPWILPRSRASWSN